ncbi:MULTISPECIES: ABC transporter permease [Mycolicibacterium]|uniref:Autoinducer 2 import system permease protein LsrD n=1 Tax=Mycolicibacterium murale TaxID=182220 RepID=A0A7I9WLF9_9MYCO|nr:MULTISPECIES: ABC transporter permease [Mycolicibacterium]BBY89964.1 ribonucleotide-diphosphate reductase subunit alpha [Mycolicibacterium tokaiense]GFG58575.1 ribonucleotide-diphosphate reductase subunit alpha [Mycolicibacterium murale]
MTAETAAPPATPKPAGRSRADRILEAVLTQRIVLLGILIVIVVAWLMYLSANGYLSGDYDFDYMSAVLIDAVPLAMLAFAQLVVIVSGRGGIDLSVGAMVSLVGMIFGFAYGQWGWPLPLAILLAVAVGALLGAVNGFLVARIGFPALIATLATYYAYKSIAMVINGQKPINSPEIQGLYSLTSSVELPVIGPYIPNVPLGVFTFLIPVLLVLWLALGRGTYGRRLYAIGTNDVAARWAGVDVAATRMRAYVTSGVLSGLVAVYITAQFASARPDAGTAGNGLALPAITIAVLGGVAITGGIGRIAGVLLATLLIVWLNAGIILYFSGNTGTQFQLLALGVVLILAALLNGLTTRRFRGGD